MNHVAIFPASHYVVPMDKILASAREIEVELEEQVRFFKSEDKGWRHSAYRSGPTSTSR